MQIATFKDMYIAGPQELAGVEDRLADALPTMSQMASQPWPTDVGTCPRQRSP